MDMQTKRRSGGTMFKLMFSLFFISSVSLANDLSKYPYNSNLSDITGVIVPPGYKPSVGAYRSTGAALPDTFDWRLSGLTPVENQGNCGSCYAFATASVLEDNVKLITGKEIDLSEQYLLDCSYANGDSYGCQGGWQLHDYHRNGGKVYQGGIAASQYPYTAQAGGCRAGLQHVDYLFSWREVSDDINSIKEAIYKFGPVWTTLYADNAFWQYTGGYYCGPTSQVNHAVTLVGWTKRGWILKNSWSENWGDRGYMEIGFGCNGVGFGTSHIVYRDQTNPDPEPPGPGPNPDPPGPFPPDQKYCPGEQGTTSKTIGKKVETLIRNLTGKDREIFWLDYSGKRISYGKLKTGYQFRVRTYVGHVWVSVDSLSANCVEMFSIKTKKDTFWKLE